MKNFTFTVEDKHGIHARPAGSIVNCAKQFESEITIKKGDKTADAKRLLAVMGIGAKCGETLEFCISGSDENEAASELHNVCLKISGKEETKAES